MNTTGNEATEAADYLSAWLRLTDLELELLYGEHESDAGGES